MEAGLGSSADMSPQNGAHIDDRDHTAVDSPGADSRPVGHGYRDKQIKPNKVYIGGLPDHTRREDLESCFGKIGNIADIELKTGFGFVEFESREAAEESVAKYHEGYFMGNKIKVELSHGGGRTKFNGEPGACFKCGQMGHWARECPNHTVHSHPRRGNSEHSFSKGSYRDYPPRDSYGYREPTRNYMPPQRDPRYGYDYPPPRRPVSPPREYRDYPPSRHMDDPRVRGPPPPPTYDSRPGYYPPPAFDERSSGYPPRGYPPPARDYDRYERRPPPPGDRYAYPPSSGRTRSPPPTNASEPRAREDFARPPPSRDFPPPTGEYRGRPSSPSRYSDYPPRSGNAAFNRRRSQSPPSRGASGSYDAYPPGAPPYTSVPPPAGPPQNAGPSRDYPPRGGEPGYRRP